MDNVDIGGVTLLRAAAKNHNRVTVLSDPRDYPGFLDELESGGISEKSRKSYALKAFEHTADYDTAIAQFLRKSYAGNGEQQISLRYGVNPHQKPATAFIEGAKLPFKVLSGSPGYINLLDILSAWPLVKELKQALGIAAATSFKHVSPAGVAIGLPLTDSEKKVFMVDDLAGLDESPLAMAYARARGSDRLSSFGDIIALSDEVDAVTAKLIGREVSDGICAPGFSSEALEILSNKKGGKYLILQMDEAYEPPPIETRTVFGVTMQQGRNDVKITAKYTFSSVAAPKNATVPDAALRDLTIATVCVKYQQSNSVCFACK